jgi:hypothetical protein
VPNISYIRPHPLISTTFAPIPLKPHDILSNMKFSRVVLSSLLLWSTSFALPASDTNGLVKRAEYSAVVSWSCLLRIAEPLTRAKARNAEMLLVRQDRPDKRQDRPDKRQDRPDKRQDRPDKKENEVVSSFF